MADETPEGKSIIELSEKIDEKSEVKNEISLLTSHFSPTYITFTAETRCSGIDIENTRIRKGASDAIKKMVEKAGNHFPEETYEMVKAISSNGGTPLVVSENEKVLGVVDKTS